ncbi:MAG TPA: ATP-binding protein [Thermoanaerobaculia bacterium]|jgi:signal transduction histidine kinase|nr:ATP-binding protein [Thermoanaerobaculia bacterium]
MSPSPSIGRSLGWLSIFSSGTALLAASLALLFFQLQEVKSSLLLRLETVADLIAFNIAPAVDFNDVEAAKVMLGSLQTRPALLSAGVVVNGRIFAVYSRKGVAPEGGDLRRVSAGHRFDDHELTVYRPISSQGRPLGTLFIHIDLHEYDQTWRRFAFITGLVAIPALLIAILIAQLPQRAISRPILNLASLAAAVSDRKDYSVRAPAMKSAAEIERLVGTFNQMLTEIQGQHAEIENARATLEQRVADRTRELESRTEQLETQGRELAAANRELESFSYSVSHDLRAPLRAIDGFSKALLSDYRAGALDQRGVHFLERVRAGTQRMSQLIDDMLHLSKVTRRPLERVVVDVTAVAQEVATELARRDPDRFVHCVIEPNLRASADSHLLTIVFENLLGNAWKFTGSREDARVEVGQTSIGGEAAFFVRDNGAGFNAAYAGKLFGAFQRLHHESEFEGTGIGLATVKRIITRHGGLVSAEGVEGVGATFYFTLGGKP